MWIQPKNISFLQQEGVPSHLLPAVVQAQREAEASEAAAASVKKEKVVELTCYIIWHCMCTMLGKRENGANIGVNDCVIIRNQVQTLALLQRCAVHANTSSR